ncbi:MAG: hypothetical protein LDL41_05275 [Coleofasciculus sp. S288]|nr:hypothetical protein [Coleofasciculus sp. S288]
MKDIALDIVLYITYFSVACWWINDPKSRKNQPELITDPNPEILENSASEAIAEETHVELTSIENTDIYDLVLQEIKGLSKRKARKLCKPLGIQQKRNNVEISQEMMIGKIVRKLRENPEYVVNVIHEQLPELLPEDKTQIQKVS